MKFISRIILLSLFTCMVVLRSPAQELFCSVSVSAPQLQSDREVYNEMQKSITEYLNNRKWTSHVFEQRERIKATIVILINERPDMNRFRGTLQVRITRPVYNSTYETVELNLQDKDFSINYVPFQTLEYSENNYVDNLTNTLNYYANLILGFDYASFAPNGGADFFGKVQNYVGLAANSKEPGWNSFDGPKSRYRLSQELGGASWKAWHTAFYQYHRNGLDLMEKDINKARTNILAAMKDIQKVNVQNPGSYLVQLFMDAKQQELINIFKGALPAEKQQLLTIIENVDPSKLSQYQDIMKTN